MHGFQIQIIMDTGFSYISITQLIDLNPLITSYADSLMYEDKRGKKLKA